MKLISMFTTLILAFTMCGCYVKPTEIELDPNIAAVETVTQTIAPTPTTTPVPDLLNEGIVDFHILHINDFHGQLIEHYEGELYVPGASKLSAFVRAEREKYGESSVILLDGGDWLEGDLTGDRTRGENVLEFYKLIGMDAVTIGNHELNFGHTRFLNVLASADPVKILSVNLQKTRDDGKCTIKHLADPYKIFTMGTSGGPQVRVAVIGATATGEEFDLRNPPLHPAVCFTDPIPKVIAIYDQVKNIEKADVTVLITHQGYKVDLAMAQALIDAGTPIDIIIGGHTHTYLEAPTMVGNTYVVQADFYGRDIGIFDLAFDRSSRELMVNWSQQFFTPVSPDDPEVYAFVQKIKPLRTPDKKVTGTPIPEGTYLIDLSPVEASVAYDYLGEGVFPFWGDGFNNGQRLESDGVKYLDGLFASAPSSITYLLDGQFSRFTSSILVKDTTYCTGGATFSVFLDDVLIYKKSGMLSWSEPEFLDLDISSGQQLKIETIPADDSTCDWTIWGNPYLVR